MGEGSQNPPEIWMCELTRYVMLIGPKMVMLIGPRMVILVGVPHRARLHSRAKDLTLPALHYPNGYINIGLSSLMRRTFQAAS